MPSFSDRFENRRRLVKWLLQRCRLIAAFAATVLLTYAASAEAAGTPGAIPDASKVSSAGDSAKAGDNFLFRQPVGIFQPYDPAKPALKEAQPADASKAADKALEANKPSDLRCAPGDSWAKILTAPSAEDRSYYVIFPSERWYELHIARGGLPGMSPSLPSTTSKECKQVENDITYKIDADSLNNIYKSRFGTSYGALVVPFKWHFSDHAVDSSSAILGYLGYEGWWTGGTSAVVFAVGMSTVNVPNNAATAQSGTSSTTAKAALTAAFGVNWTFGTTTQWKGAVLVGWDWAGKSSGYPYEYHPWLAVSLGLGF